MHFKKLTVFVLVCAMILGLCAPAVSAAGAIEPGYVLRGSLSGNTYTLRISIRDIEAFGGRIGLCFDTQKLKLIGPDGLGAFHLETGVNSLDEVRPESQMVSGDGGYACLAWYANGSVNATQSEQTIASLQFQTVGDVTANSIDSTSFRLRCIEEGSFGPWQSPLTLYGRGSLASITYCYMADRTKPMGIDFAYDGADNVPTSGKTVRFVCKTKLESTPVAATMQLGGRTYQTDANGVIELKLASDDYLWAVEAAGYGMQRSKLSVAADTEQTILFIDDAELVKQTAADLKITYREGDSAQRVTGTVGLPMQTSDGVSIAWASDHSDIITSDGMVFLPATTQATVKLTATLTKGSAKAEKSFTVTVLSKKQLADNANPSGGSDSQTPTGATGFLDLAGYEWARGAIEKLAKAGVIKGVSATQFGPGRSIKRGDYIAMLMRMLDPAGTPTTAFDDVPSGSYYFTEIAQARVLGIVTGTGNNRFEPEKPITRQDMMTMTARAIERTSYLAASQKTGDLKQFADADKISSYALQGVADMVGRGLITGDAKQCLNPAANATRAETAVFLERILSAHS